MNFMAKGDEGNKMHNLVMKMLFTESLIKNTKNDEDLKKSPQCHRKKEKTPGCSH